MYRYDMSRDIPFIQLIFFLQSCLSDKKVAFYCKLNCLNTGGKAVDCASSNHSGKRGMPRILLGGNSEVFNQVSDVSTRNGAFGT